MGAYYLPLNCHWWLFSAAVLKSPLYIRAKMQVALQRGKCKQPYEIRKCWKVTLNYSQGALTGSRGRNKDKNVQLLLLKPIPKHWIENLDIIWLCLFCILFILASSPCVESPCALLWESWWNIVAGSDGDSGLLKSRQPLRGFGLKQSLSYPWQGCPRHEEKGTRWHPDQLY